MVFGMQRCEDAKMRRCKDAMFMGFLLKNPHKVLESGDIKIGTTTRKGPAKTGIVTQCFLDLCPAALIGHMGQKLFDSILFTDKICIVSFLKTHI